MLRAQKCWIWLDMTYSWIMFRLSVLLGFFHIICWLAKLKQRVKVLILGIPTLHPPIEQTLTFLDIHHGRVDGPQEMCHKFSFTLDQGQNAEVTRLAAWQAQEKIFKLFNQRGPDGTCSTQLPDTASSQGNFTQQQHVWRPDKHPERSLVAHW